MTNLGRLADRNRRFAATDARTQVPAIPFQPRQGLYLLTCIDCRVDPAQILGTELGDCLVQRNIGGRATAAVIDDIAYAAYLVEAKAPDGPWFEVAVIHHTDCGSGFLADDELRAGYADRIGADERDLADLAVIEPHVTVRTDVERIRQAKHVPDSVAVSGHVYDVATGIVTTVVEP